MKKKIIPVLIVLTLIIILSISLAASIIKEKYTPTDETMDLSEYYSLADSDSAAIILNHEIIEEQGIVIDGQIYLSYDFLHSNLNSRLYYDSSEEMLLLASDDSLMEIRPDTAEYTDGNSQETWSSVIFTVRDDSVYINSDFVQEHSLYTCTHLSDPERLVITTDFSEIETAVSGGDTEVRYRGGIKSPILTSVTENETVTVLARDEKWTKVQTDDGVIGYMLSSKVSDGSLITPEAPEDTETWTHIKLDQTVCMLWHQVAGSRGNNDISSVLANTGDINVISPTWFYLNDNEGNIVDFSSSSYVETCHENGIQVWGLVSNLENPDVNTAAVLTDMGNRQHLIDQLIQAAVSCGMDGINVDFESLDADTVGDSFIEFIRELSIRCKANDLILSVDNYVMTSYSAFYNRSEQAKFADYVIIMAYDEHYNGSSDGSIASIPWVEEGITGTMDYVPADQIILGCPFYTRIWKLTPKNDGDTSTADVTDAGYDEDMDKYDIDSEIAGMKAAANSISSNGAVAEWSEEDGQNYAEWTSGDTICRVWLEDTDSMTERLALADKYQLAGVSFWKYGFETDEIWDLIDSTLK